MAFWGHSFAFDGIPCEDFDLMIYDIGSNTQSNGKFASTVNIIEDKVAARYKPYFYGITYENRLEFTLIFGANQKRIDKQKYLDRYELEAIASWLTGRDQYLWLDIEQDDLEYVRYKCIVTGLDMVEYGNLPWALKADIVCDSPYAYMYPQTFTFNVSGTQTVTFYNESSHNGFYRPAEMSITLPDGGDFSIENLSDKNRIFAFSGVPASIRHIHVNNDLGIIAGDGGINVYPYFNFRFFRLVKGDNILKITGNGKLGITCEFPINAGG